ncbi:MAG: adenylate/guanylate cyclase domain-containing protein [Gammaproteobacteria bacterium]
MSPYNTETSEPQHMTSLKHVSLLQNLFSEQDWSSNTRLRYLYIILGALLVFVYTQGHAPQMQLDNLQLFMLTCLTFLAMAVARMAIDYWVFVQDPSQNIVNTEFFISLGLYIGGAVFGFVMIRHNIISIPAIIAYKFAIGTVVYGYFVAVDSALNTERRCYYERRFIFAKDIHFESSTKRLRLFIVTTILITIVALYFSAHLILYQLLSSNRLNVESMRNVFLYDIVIMTLMIIGFAMRVAYSYAKNQQHLLDSQIHVLEELQKGNLDSFVPIMSQDEFAMLAQQTNKLIEELREKQKVTSVLERIVSPNIMQKLLGGDAQMLRQGQDYEVAILFCDLRRFTNFVENTPPDVVIRFLNAFFAKISDLITAHNGLINKFMGDAILAVFGVEGKDNAALDAIQTAMHIISHTKNINLGDDKEFDIGVGIHMGRAVAGTIGSADRYEYTFIGDVVNTASRLDGLSKRLGYRIIVSDNVFRLLPEEERSTFVDLGPQRVRGKSDPVHVYGAVSDYEVSMLKAN